MVFKATICGSVHPKWTLTAFQLKKKILSHNLKNLCIRGYIVLWTKYQKTRQSYWWNLYFCVMTLLKIRIEGSESLFWFINPVEWFNIGMSKLGDAFMTLL